MAFDNSRNTVRHHGGKVGANGKRGGQHYAAVPVELARDPRLTHAARSVAIYIWSHDEKWQQSISAVATALGTDRKTVAAALASLQGAGWMVREKLGAKRERWHLQMSNIPFTPQEVEEILRNVEVEEKLPNVSPTEVEEKLPNPSEGMGRNSPTVWGEIPQPTEEKLPMKVVDSGVHPEVHSSSAITDQDETASYGRSLADAGSEAPEGADGRGLGGPSLEEAASESAAEHTDPFGSGAEPATAREAPKGLVGLRPATGGRYEDPFACEQPAWVVEALEREERARERDERIAASRRVPDIWEDPFAS